MYSPLLLTTRPLQYIPEGTIDNRWTIRLRDLNTGSGIQRFINDSFTLPY